MGQSLSSGIKRTRWKTLCHERYKNAHVNKQSGKRVSDRQVSKEVG